MYTKFTNYQQLSKKWKPSKTIGIVILLSLVSALTFYTYLTFLDSLNQFFILITQYQYEKPYHVVCYYSLSQDNDTIWNLQPSKIDPQICTHIIIAFAGIANNSITLGQDLSKYKEVTDLKNRNPGLKIMLSVGGAGEDVSAQFRSMTENHAKRKIFIGSVLEAIKMLCLDGLDVDWEYPSWLHKEETTDTGMSFRNFKLGDEREKIHFVQLIEELRMAFDRSGCKLLLSIAVGAPKAIVDQSYNVGQIFEHVDFINLMSYDYHFYISYFPVTDLNAPLFSNKLEQDYLANLNVNFSANYWVQKGMPREKIVVGIPAYGHSYKLLNYNNHDLHSPAQDFGDLGNNGFVNYSSICEFLSSGATEVFVTESRVPYAFKDNEWISYDDVLSVSFKALWIKENNFRGAMIYSLNSDDWGGKCSSSHTFPLVRSINNILN